MSFTPPGQYTSSYQSASYVQPPPVPLPVSATTTGYHSIPTFTSSHVGAALPTTSYMNHPAGSFTQSAVAPPAPASTFYQSAAQPPQARFPYPYPSQSRQPTTNQPATFITSGSVGRIIPAEQPYAFTTVTYAKQPVKPNHDEFKKAYARQTLQNLDDDRAPRIVKRQKGACGGLNECMCGCCDSNGGCCGCLNCGGCCDREQHVPVSIATVPRTSKGCC